MTLVTPAPRPAGVHAVEVDEAHRLIEPVGVRHAGPQSARHERQVRVGVLRLLRLLLLGQLGPPLHLVVLVPGPFREHRPEQLDVRHHAGLALIQPRGEALIEIAGGGVEGAAEDALIGVERVAEATA